MGFWFYLCGINVIAYRAFSNLFFAGIATLSLSLVLIKNIIVTMWAGKTLVTYCSHKTTFFDGPIK